QACAPDECGNAAFDTVLAHALRKVRTIGAAAPDHLVTVHVVGRVARVHATDVRTQRGGIAARVLRLVVEVVVALGICAQCWIVLLSRENEWSATAPATHHLRRDELLLFRCL